MIKWQTRMGILVSAMILLQGCTFRAAMERLVGDVPAKDSRCQLISVYVMDSNGLPLDFVDGVAFITGPGLERKVYIPCESNGVFLLRCAPQSQRMVVKVVLSNGLSASCVVKDIKPGERVFIQMNMPIKRDGHCT